MTKKINKSKLKKYPAIIKTVRMGKKSDKKRGSEKKPPMIHNTLRKTVRKAMADDQEKSLYVDEFVDIITKDTGCRTAGDLRLLTTQEWLDLDLPLLFKLGLRKHLSEKQHLSRVETYEKYFNDGQRLDLQPFNAKVEEMVGMGFARGKALESLLMSKKANKDLSLKYLLAGKNQQDAYWNKYIETKRVKSFQKYKKSLDEFSNDDQMFVQAIEMDKIDCLDFDRFDLAWRESLRVEMVVTKGLQEEAQARSQNVICTAYKSFLEGLLVAGPLDPEKIQTLAQYRASARIDDTTHEKALKALGVLPENWKESPSEEQSDGLNDCCYVCFERPKTHLVIGEQGCAHFCLCGPCASDLLKKGYKKCPICSKKIEKIEKVHFECFSPFWILFPILFGFLSLFGG